MSSETLGNNHSTTDLEPSSPKKIRKPRRSLIAAALLQRCPRCREGRLFHGIAQMSDPCPVCGLVFEREPGYFLGAMYFSYALAVLIIAPLFIVLYQLFPTWPGPVMALLAMLPTIPLIPIIFRYSRVLWLYFERWAAPTELSSNETWLKMRQQAAQSLDRTDS